MEGDLEGFERQFDEDPLDRKHFVGVIDSAKESFRPAVSLGHYPEVVYARAC